MNLQDYVQLSQFTSGRARYALARMAALTSVRDRPKLAAAVDHAQASADAVADLDAAWATQRAQAEGRGEATALDATIDRTVGAVHAQIQTRLGLLAPDDPLAKAGAAFLARTMPEGAVAITTLSFEDELQAVERMVAYARGEGAEVVERFELAFLITTLEALLPKFRAELDAFPARDLSFDVVRAARARMQRALAMVVVWALAEYGGEDGDAETLARVLTPLRQQEDRIRALRRSRRPVLDVDPDNGEELTDAVGGSGDADPDEA